MTYDVQHLFICAIFAICMSTLVSWLDLLPAFKLGCSFCCCCCWGLSALYMFWIQVLYQICFCKYFLPGCALSLHSLNRVSFVEQKFFTSMTSNLAIFSFMEHAFSIVSKNSLSNTRSPRFSLLLSFYILISFIFLHFTFWSMIDFESLFLKDIRSVSRFIFLNMNGSC